MKNEILALIKGKGITVIDFVRKLNEDHNDKISVNTFYRKLNSQDEWDIADITAISKELGLDFQETGNLFFSELVS